MQRPRQVTASEVRHIVLGGERLLSRRFEFAAQHKRGLAPDQVRCLSIISGRHKKGPLRFSGRSDPLRHAE
jgi:hypothetical protein